MWDLLECAENPGERFALAVRSTASQVSVVIPAGTPDFYANFTQVFVTEWDFLLVLGSTHLETGDANELTATARADILVRMSPQHAKSMLNTLAELVGQYEKDFGEMGLKEVTTGGETQQPQSTRAQRRRDPS